MAGLICSGPDTQHRLPSSVTITKLRGWFKREQFRCYFTGIALTVLFFVADVILPRGATPAIGYCLALVVSAGARHQRFLIGLTLVCSILTWAGYFLEPAGAVWWMSVFDRAMITMVIWVAFILICRRMQAMAALAYQTRALELATKELERSNADLDSFASVIAHDLRSPLNTVELFAQMMDDRRLESSIDEKHESLDSMQKEIDHMSHLIQRLLAYGRVGSGSIRREACNCEAVLGSVRQNLKFELQASGGEITHEPLPMMDADPILIAELFQNLIENSLKYRSSVPPMIHISATETVDGFQFTFQDNGIGFQTMDSQQIFIPFKQLRRDQGGVGLGLSTCKKIIERHQGRIWAESQPGHGATFHFTIPRTPCAALL